MSTAANPRAPKPEDVGIAQEPTGPIAADSLAAESIANKEKFSENTNATPLGVRGDQSTLNTTDTSGATELAPADDGTDRVRQEALGAGSDEKGVTGLKYPDAAGQPEFSGQISGDGSYSGGASGTSAQASSGSGLPAGASDFGASTTSSSTGGPDSSQIKSGDAATSGSGSGSGTSAGETTSTVASSGTDSGSSGPAAGTGVRPQVDAAPNYTASVTGAAAPAGTFKPKGANLDDADETDSIPKTKTFVGAVGSVNDPGRLAEREFEGRNNDPIGELGQAGEEGGRARQKGEESQGGTGGQYDVLESERA